MNRYKKMQGMNYTNEISKSLGVISEMLIDRGLDAKNLSRVSEREIQAIVNMRNMFSIAAGNVTIVYDLSPRFKWVDTKKYIESLESDDDVNGRNGSNGNNGSDKSTALFIIVIKELADCKKVVDFDVADFQVFSIKDLQFNRAKHVLVPKHELVKTDEEIASILTNYQLKSITQLPLILKTDPMSKYLNAKSGNVIKVTRISPTCGENVVYRCVA